ncbi:protease [Sporocytophaga myxococcoides]|uniref:Protease n=2 Tax=Sporocytophaga myxococcoides TaxID=153721 RepID=A0A098LA45_9BACT|nr:protease [Sporocytophaga myxococcoides]
MVKNLLILNIGVFLIMVFTKVDLIDIFGLRYLEATDFRPYQLFTHMFIHSGWGHLFSNMFGLFMFGPLLEKMWGSKRFLAFYMICGLGAALIYSGVEYFEMEKLNRLKLSFISSPSPESYIKFSRDALGNDDLSYPQLLNLFEKNPDNKEIIDLAKNRVISVYNKISNIPSVGASGALFGILLAFGMLFPNTELMMLFIPIPIKAKYFVAMYGIFELYSGVQRNPGDHVGHFAHLGGMLFAFLIVKYWERERNRFY